MTEEIIRYQSRFITVTTTRCVFPDGAFYYLSHLAGIDKGIRERYVTSLIFWLLFTVVLSAIAYLSAIMGSCSIVILPIVTGVITGIFFYKHHKDKNKYLIVLRWRDGTRREIQYLTEQESEELYRIFYASHYQ